MAIQRQEVWICDECGREHFFTTDPDEPPVCPGWIVLIKRDDAIDEDEDGEIPQTARVFCSEACAARFLGIITGG